jgi:hypothetical protein
MGSTLFQQMHIPVRAALQTAGCFSKARCRPLSVHLVACNNRILWYSQQLTPVKQRIMQSQREHEQDSCIAASAIITCKYYRIMFCDGVLVACPCTRGCEISDWGWSRALACGQGASGLETCTVRAHLGGFDSLWVTGLMWMGCLQRSGRFRCWEAPMRC